MELLVDYRWLLDRQEEILRAYLEAAGTLVDTAYEPWRDLVNGIRALSLDSYAIAERLRSLQIRRA
ncbi:hypothetical protein ACFVZ4_31750 [Streptomyces goshikiensis]|uniref:hypothetical protein n=1 Tax=Streptomyces goshikiensis TaxID=1942 RepID=UPI0036CBE8F1